MTDIDDKLLEAYETLGIGVGDIFEDCAFHPVLCLGADYKKDELWGISLIDGSQPRCCSLIHCGVRKLSLDEAWRIKMHGPLDESDRALIAIEHRWWSEVATRRASMEVANTIFNEDLRRDRSREIQL
jgi:hypothetical protein